MPNFTKIAIQQSFLRLLRQRPITKITVKDIVEDCGINRNSFYYHFQDLPQLLETVIIERRGRDHLSHTGELFSGRGTDDGAGAAGGEQAGHSQHLGVAGSGVLRAEFNAGVQLCSQPLHCLPLGGPAAHPAGGGAGASCGFLPVRAVRPGDQLAQSKYGL